MLILASTSPRRKAILESLGLEFEIAVPEGLDESLLLGGGLVARTEIQSEEKLVERVERLASLKAYSVANLNPARLVLGADTIVAIDSVVLGKPSDADAAFEMLRMLSGRTHFVYTSLALVNIAEGLEITATEKTAVTFNSLSESRIRKYVEIDAPYDKAGGYAIQGIGSLLVRRISGCYWNVVGLPVGLLDRMLLQVGINLL
ncbi:MAG: septum formation protein Maf [bacterium]